MGITNSKMSQGLNNIINRLQRNRIVILFAALIVVYIIFISIRPYEQDESHYILSGKAIINGGLNPLKPIYYGHFSNPFGYIVGSPLVPLVYGAAYIAGGMVLTRLLAMISVLLSLYFLYLLIRRNDGNPTFPLILVGFSSCTILIATDAFLDSFALLFLVISLWLLETKRYAKAGFVAGIAMISKFILFMPFSLVLIYLIVKRNWKRFLFGMLVILLPFVIAYSEMMPIIIDFIFGSRIIEGGLGKEPMFLSLFFACAPVATVLGISTLKSKRIRIKVHLWLPFVAMLIFHIITLETNSLFRHIPYIEFTAAILVGIKFRGIKPKYYLLVAIYILLSLATAFSYASNYPSYNGIENQLGNINGNILALNLHAYTLIRDLPINSTGSGLYSYYYLSYDNETGSSMNDYEAAIKDGFFDYALISSHSPESFPRYVQIENLVREYYCPVYETERFNGIDIYKRCD